MPNKGTEINHKPVELKECLFDPLLYPLLTPFAVLASPKTHTA